MILMQWGHGGSTGIAGITGHYHCSTMTPLPDASSDDIG